MEQNNTVIYKVRDFGELIGDPIKFFFEEIKFLSKNILFFVGPFVLLSAIITGMYGGGNANIISSLISGDFPAVNSRSQGASFLLLVQFIQTIVLYSLVGVYIKLYIKKGRGNFTSDDIWNGIKKFFFPVFGGYLLMALMIIVGFFLLFFPGVYISIVMTIVIPIIILEEDGVANAISRAFDLMKGNWWFTFGILLVFGILSSIFTLTINGIVAGVFAFGSRSATVVAISGALISIVTAIVTSAYAFVPVFLYASFVSEKEDPNLAERIKNISKNVEEVNPTEKSNTINSEIKEEKEIDEDDVDVWEKLLNENKNKKPTKETKDETEKESVKKKDDGENNRFLNDDNNRFKPKY